MKELGKSELTKINGGFLPLIAIYVCWGIMGACSLIALGMQEALNESNHKQTSTDFEGC